MRILGVDVEKLNALLNAIATDANLNEYGRFDELKGTIDKQRDRTCFKPSTGDKLSPAKVNNVLHDRLTSNAVMVVTAEGRVNNGYIAHLNSGCDSGHECFQK